MGKAVYLFLVTKCTFKNHKPGNVSMTRSKERKKNLQLYMHWNNLQRIKYKS